jgi:hypothetical protein
MDGPASDRPVGADCAALGAALFVVDRTIDRARMLPGKLWQARDAAKRRGVRDRLVEYTARVEIVTVSCGNCAVL